ncbi:MAG TPA: hypothetical protein VD999_04280 [Vitreimonas sp.]|nr:hypothetical protein [Vitreimonas sp.]
MTPEDNHKHWYELTVYDLSEKERFALQNSIARALLQFDLKVGVAEGELKALYFANRLSIEFPHWAYQLVQTVLEKHFPNITYEAIKIAERDPSHEQGALALDMVMALVARQKLLSVYEARLLKEMIIKKEWATHGYIFPEIVNAILALPAEVSTITGYQAKLPRILKRPSKINYFRGSEGITPKEMGILKTAIENLVNQQQIYFLSSKIDDEWIEDERKD